MADEVKTVRVTGLPVDISENRLVDKLQIHFLRKKNGGGEISAVTVSRMMPGTAFITFEESHVAMRLAQKGQQVFKVTDKTYDITISLHQEEVDVDKVLLNMLVEVDHRKVPGGRNTLLSLHKGFPDVCLKLDEWRDIYTLQGSYSKVQCLCNLLLVSLGNQVQSSCDLPQTKKDNKKMYNSPWEECDNSPFRANEDVGAVKHTMLREDLDLEHDKHQTGLPLPGSYSDHPSVLMEDTWDSVPDTGMPFEEFSLIVDSDIFRYLHKYCSEEYLSILTRHRVDVLDVSCDDITTLFLTPKTARSRHDVSSIIKAHKDLALLYQQKELQLRKEHIDKRGIPEKELARALETLRLRLPKLMVDEEDGNVYMVGNKNDVSEAKQFLSDIQGFGTEKEIHSDHLFVPFKSKSTVSKQGSAAASDPSGICTPSFPDSDQLSVSKKDRQDVNQRRIPSDGSSKKQHNSVKVKTLDDQSPAGFTFQPQRIEKPTEDIFSFTRTDDSQEGQVLRDRGWMETAGGLDRNKYTDSLFDSSRSSAQKSILDFNKADFISETTKLQSETESETQNKSSKGSKNKTGESGKERKMAANFNSEKSNSIKNVTSYKLDKGTCVKERQVPDVDQPHSVPLTKPSTDSNLDPNISHGSTSAKKSTSKKDNQEVKREEMSKFADVPYDKKPELTPACVSEDQAAEGFPSGPTLRRSNSLSGKIKEGEDTEAMAVELPAGQKGTDQSSQTREIVAMDLVLPFRLWIYLTSVYNTEIENLTSDLRVREELDKEDITLWLTGVGSEKVSECHHALKSLICRAEKDFDTRTLPLSRFGVTDSKDGTLIESCTLMKQRYKTVKILVMTNDVVILGPKPLCDEVEAVMTKVLNQQGHSADFKMDNKSSPKPDSLHMSKASNGNQSATSSEPHTDTIMKDLSKMSDQNVTWSSKHIPQVLSTQTRDNQEKDNQSWGQTTKKELEQLDQKGSSLKLGDGGARNNKNGETSSDNCATRDMSSGKNNKDHTSPSAQIKETFTEQMNPVEQIRDPQGSPDVSEPKKDKLPSCAKGKEVHDTIRTCSTSGIKGTISVQESTVTIPGFNRDTTLRIVYDIPDGIQGEDHPCPGAPFKGNRFEAFLPENKSTKQLLPLLKKAFDKGLTFTVKVPSSDHDGSREGRVVWGSIPHKTNTEGGASRNGYPDPSYIRRLEEALKAAGVTE